MNKARALVLLAVLVFAASVPAFADSYTITFTPDAGSTGGGISATTSQFTTGPVTLDWGNAVFTLSAADLSEILADCSPLPGTTEACATYDASDAGVYEPKINVQPILDLNDDAGAKTAFTLYATSADSSCLIDGCDSSGVVSISDKTAVATPESGSFGLTFLGLVGLGLVTGRKRRLLN